MLGAGGGRRRRRASLIASGSGSTANVTSCSHACGRLRHRRGRRHTCGTAHTAGWVGCRASTPDTWLACECLEPWHQGRCSLPLQPHKPPTHQQQNPSPPTHPHAAILGAGGGLVAAVAELQQHDVVSVALELAHLPRGGPLAALAHAALPLLPPLRLLHLLRPLRRGGRWLVGGSAGATR